MDPEDNLNSRKKKFVRDAIHNSAIELFAKSGFDEITVDEIAEAAGVSRRSFFRYFASKDDLLAQSTLNFGATLVAAIESAPPHSSPVELLRRAVLSIAGGSSSFSLSRKTIEIAAKSTSARQAYLSRMPEVEDNLLKAYLVRMKQGSADMTKARLLAALTLTITNVAITSWFKHEYRDVSTASRQTFQNVMRIFAELDPGGSNKKR
jgi:AcrR family transcriptional regulator